MFAQPDRPGFGHNFVLRFSLSLDEIVTRHTMTPLPGAKPRQQVNSGSGSVKPQAVVPDMTQPLPLLIPRANTSTQSSSTSSATLQVIIPAKRKKANLSITVPRRSKRAASIKATTRITHQYVAIPSYAETSGSDGAFED